MLTVTMTKIISIEILLLIDSKSAIFNRHFKELFHTNFNCFKINEITFSKFAKLLNLREVIILLKKTKNLSLSFNRNCEILH